MTATVDGEPYPVASLGWPPMNFGQFHWERPIGHYELVIPRTTFTDRLAGAYRQMVLELRADDLMVPGQTSPLREADYPPLDTLPEHPAAFFEAVEVYLWDHFFEAFLPSTTAFTYGFVLNSIESATATGSHIHIAGRGYYMGRERSERYRPT